MNTGNTSIVKLNGIDFRGVRIAVEPEEKLRHYLLQSIHNARPLKVTPITMKEIMKIFFFSAWRRRYRKLDFVYPDSRFSCRCLFNYNLHFQGERRIYSYRLLLDLIENIFKERLPLTLIGLDENQKNDLQRKLKFLFTENGDICFLHPTMVRHRPDAIAAWLNRYHYSFIIVQVSQKLQDLFLDRLHQGLLFLDNGQMDRHRRDWKKKPRWYLHNTITYIFNLGRLFSVILKVLWRGLTLYYLVKVLFSITFWLFSFIINKTKRKCTFIID